MFTKLTNLITEFFKPTPIVPSNNGKAWSDEDIRHVAVHCSGSHESIAECALSLGRTESSIRTLYYKCRKTTNGN